MSRPIHHLTRVLAAGAVASLAAAGVMAADTDPPLYDDTTPPFEIITLPAPDGGYVSFRAERRDVTLWGRRLAVLLYSGPLAARQTEFNDGRYSLITVPRNPAAETLFLREQVWPAIGRPPGSIGRLKGLALDEVLPPDDMRLDSLEENLLRAAWHQRAVSAGLIGVAASRVAALRSTQARNFRQQVIAEAERNGFLHEAQHALDEAHRVAPELYAPPLAGEDDAELRAILAALAHSETPHYVLYFALRQYRQEIAPYDAAVADLLGLLARAIAAAGERRGIRLDRNLILQIPRLGEAELRDAAARVMRSRYAERDRAAGYRLDYAAREDVGGLRVGELRGTIRPEDIPGWSREPEGREAAWWFEGASFVSGGAHVYFSRQGVRVARRKSLGLAIDGGGYVAVHVRTPAPGRWLLRLEGGTFTAGDEAGRELPLRILPGEQDALRARPHPSGEAGLFQVEIPSGAARDGILRLVLTPSPDAAPASFLTAFSLRVEAAE